MLYFRTFPKYRFPLIVFATKNVMPFFWCLSEFEGASRDYIEQGFLVWKSQKVLHFCRSVIGWRKSHDLFTNQSLVNDVTLQYDLGTSLLKWETMLYTVTFKTWMSSARVYADFYKVQYSACTFTALHVYVLAVTLVNVILVVVGFLRGR